MLYTDSSTDAKITPLEETNAVSCCVSETLTQSKSNVKLSDCFAIPQRVQTGLVENILRLEKSQFCSCLSSLLGVWKDGDYRGLCGSESFLTFWV